jgi:predicted metalloprotease with PDZ domain
MKKFIFLIPLLCPFFNYAKTQLNITDSTIRVVIDLMNVKDDKVTVTITPPKITSKEIQFSLPKTVPGTYSFDNYGRFIEGMKAYDAQGKELSVIKNNINSWRITNAEKLIKLTYSVNDTYDIETGEGFGKGDVFSPAGSNINEGKNFMLNMHCFVGYFSDFLSMPYQVTIEHPLTLWGATSMIDSDDSKIKDVFTTSRYAELVENPIMYAKPNYTTFKVKGMEILIAIYSPESTITAKSILKEMKTTFKAQKIFLGSANETKKYSVLLYLSDGKKTDATGSGALEHPSATTVVLPENMGRDYIVETLKDVVSHEFFHILTPLTIHSKEVENFDFNNPKMSKHLWMYEGVTEYFANLFQINQDLINEVTFYKRLSDKIEQAKSFNDTIPFTTMSANVLEKPYKEQYVNVYNKGALIAMCLDILIREKSNGKKGILDLMQKLSAEYGSEKSFNDSELFDKITALTYPEVGVFLSTYVAGPNSINYEEYFAKVGVTRTIVKVPEINFGLTLKKSTNEISITQGESTSFMKALDLRSGDIITAINNTNYDISNVNEMVTKMYEWQEGEDVSFTIKRDGKLQTISGKVYYYYKDTIGFQATDSSKENLKNTWLKG